MKLAEYLAANSISQTEFARQIERPQATVFRYVNGQRIPEPEIMAAIVRATGGAVQPNDFYPVANEVLAS